jgi:hypothetical protein
MGGNDIQDNQLEVLNVEIVEKKSGGDRKLKVPQENLAQYLDLIRKGMTAGFWNEVLGDKEIIFIFKFKDGSLKEYTLSTENERELDKICAEFNGQTLSETSNVYKWLSENKFYHDFMLEHYLDMINR